MPSHRGEVEGKGRRRVGKEKGGKGKGKHKRGRGQVSLQAPPSDPPSVVPPGAGKCMESGVAGARGGAETRPGFSTRTPASVLCPAARLQA